MAAETVTHLDDDEISERFDVALPSLQRYNPDRMGAMRPARDGAYMSYTDVRALVIQMIRLRELLDGAR